MGPERLFAAALLGGCALTIFAALLIGRLRLPHAHGVFAGLAHGLGRLAHWLHVPPLHAHAAQAAGGGVPLAPVIGGLGLLAFGAVGLAARGADTPPTMAIILAVAACLAVALALGLCLGPALRRGEQAGVVQTSSHIGATGRVSLAIPAGGTGQVAYTVDGRTAHMPARRRDGQAVPAGTAVLVADIVDHVVYVENL